MLIGIKHILKCHWLVICKTLLLTSGVWAMCIYVMTICVKVNLKDDSQLTEKVEMIQTDSHLQSLNWYGQNHILIGCSFIDGTA